MLLRGINVMKYKLAIFDMDGTILDTLEDLADGLNHVLSKYKYPVCSIDQVRSYVGNGIRRLIERGAPDGLSEDVIDQLVEDFTPYYKANCTNKTKPYDGIKPLLNTLKEQGCLVAVVSNKVDSAVKELCNHYFPSVFDCAIGERDGIRKKPAPDSVLETMAQLKVDMKDAVYIGDSEVDIQTAKNAKIDCISVDWGFRDHDYIKASGAEVIVSKPMEIANLITRC